jgi:hypothetical protein
VTPISFGIPTTRTLPPAVAYAAGLVCELRPDLADGVRAAVLGDAAMTALDVMTLARVEAGDKQGADALSCLREIVYYGGNAPKALHGLADVLGLIPACPADCAWYDHPDGFWLCVPRTNAVVRFLQPVPGPPPVGARGRLLNSAFVIGVPMSYGAKWTGDTGVHLSCVTADALRLYLSEGWGAAWARLPPACLSALRAWFVALHAHTVSLDPAVRAAWAKAHLDALADPVRPQSPDRLT